MTESPGEWQRVHRPGPLRWLIAGIWLLTTVLIIGSTTLALLTVSGHPENQGWALVVATLGAGSIWALSRFLFGGVSVCLRGIRYLTVRRTVTALWPDVTDLDIIDHESTTRLRLTLASGRQHTVLSSQGLDFVARREAFDIAVAATLGWWHDYQPTTS
jgi:hypothetical protein